MGSWSSFLKKKGVPTAGDEPQGPMTSIMILLDRIDCRALAATAQGVTGDVLFFVLGSEFARETPDDLQFSFRAGEVRLAISPA